jgi:hypothetical protein
MIPNEYAPDPAYVSELGAVLPELHKAAAFLGGLSRRECGPPAGFTAAELREVSDRLHEAGRIIQRGLDDIPARDQSLIVGSGAESLRPRIKPRPAALEFYPPPFPSRSPHILVNGKEEKKTVMDGGLVPMVKGAVRTLQELAAIDVAKHTNGTDETLPQAAKEHMTFLKHKVLPLVKNEEELSKALLQQEFRDAAFRDIGPVCASETEKECADPEGYRQHLQGLYADKISRDRMDVRLGSVDNDDSFSRREELKTKKRGYNSLLEKP